MALTTRRIALGCLGAAMLWPGSALAFPDRQVQIIVPFGPGGFSDILARFMAEALAPRLGRPVVVENRPGAGGNIAAEAVVRAPADGQTLLLAGQAITSINPSLYARLPFDAERDFTAVAFLAEAPNLLIGGPATPGTDLASFIAAARARPGAYSYGSFGVGSVSHLGLAMFAAAAGIEMEHIPYRQAAAMTADLLGGRIHLAFESAGSAVPQIRAGTVRGLGTGGAARLADLPNLPAVAEVLPGFEVVGWFALLASARIPEPALMVLRREIAAVMASPAFAAFLAARGAGAMAVRGEDGAAFLASDRARWGAAVRSSGARAE